jgi:hypothetical protein
MKEDKSRDLMEKIIRSFNYKNCSLPEGFSSGLSEKLQKAGSMENRSFYGKLMFISAVILITFLTGFFIGKINTPVDKMMESVFEQSVIASIDVIKGEPFTVKLVYESEYDVDDVDFDIVLPEGLVFYSDHPEIAEKRTISWAGILKKGRNEIPFVVKSVELGNWRIDASAQFGDKVLAHEIIVNSKDDQPLNREVTAKEEQENV